MEKYKVALVSDWYYPKVGGIEYSIHSLARHLRGLGHDVDIITREQPRDAASPITGDLDVIRLDGINFKDRLFSPTAFSRLRHTLDRGRYNVVHAHGLDSPMAMAALFHAKRARIPSVTSNHSLIGDIPFRASILKGCELCLRASDAVIAVSSAVQNESRLITQKPVYLIPNGIDRCSPNGAARELPFEKKGRFVITTVSRMTKKKGVDDLINIALRMVGKFDHLLFLMVGDGPLKAKLEKRVRKLGISDHFMFTGEVSRGTVLALLEQSDSFVLPSRREAFGIVILEAFSKKIPVVARNHSGVSDIITHNVNGLLADDELGLEKHLEQLVCDKELADSLSTAASGEVHKYRWREIAQRVETVYGRVIRENSNTIH